MRYFRAIALDYDGTLTDSPRPEAVALAAISRVRAAGVRVVLVTGRILAELRADFAEVDDCFDAIVAENGAVLSRWNHSRLLAPRIPPELSFALAARGVAHRRGEALLAGDARDDSVALAEIGRLGLDCQLVHNRGALMILPAGISKGSGLYEALGDLGVSHHNTIAIGDAENDHTLLAACELGVAVGSAVDSLKSRADLVLEPSSGAVVALLERLAEGDLASKSPRHQITLGAFEDGTPVEIPASRVNVLIAGESGSGKSYLAGLIAEQLLAKHYSLCAIDPEGDHQGLAAMRGVVVAGASSPLPDRSQLATLVHHRFGSVVLDLSLVAPTLRRRYCHEILLELGRLRSHSGLPHWIFMDEAHVPLASESSLRSALGDDARALCLVTYHPYELAESALASADVAIRCLGRGRAVLWRREHPTDWRPFNVAARDTAHVRHRHKYSDARLAPERRFYFYAGAGRPTARSAGNLHEFHDELARADELVVSHHAQNNDFSRWIADTLKDAELAQAAHDVEERVITRALNPTEARRRLLRAVRARYFVSEAAS